MNKQNELIKQFLNTSKERISIEDESFETHFKLWLQHRKYQADRYAEMLKSLGLDIHGEDIAEINSSYYDTVTIPSEPNIIVTSALNGFNPGQYDKRIILQNFFSYSKHGTPYYYDFDKYGRIKGQKLQGVSTFMTSNIMSGDVYTDFKHLHNDGKDIIVGVFGEVHDKDRADKLRKLRMFKDKLLDYKDEYTVTDNDNYFSVVYTSDKHI